MDQDVFRQTYREFNQVYCAFEKCVLTNECRCRWAERFCIAEREGVSCRSAAGQARCIRWLELLREHARFALRSEEDRRLMPHGKAIRLQIGGIRGLVRALGASVDDVDETLSAAEKTYGALSSAPIADIMRDVAAYKVRKRARRR